MQSTMASPVAAAPRAGFWYRWSRAVQRRPVAAGFFQQAHVGDGHAAVHGFAHVINREQGDLHGGEGFHLDAGLTHRFYSRCALHAV